MLSSLTVSDLSSSTDSKFFARSAQLAVTLNSLRQSSLPRTESRLLDDRLANLQGHDELFTAVQAILSDRIVKEDQIIDSPPTAQPGQDSQEALSEVNDLASVLSNYQNTVRTLLRLWKFPGVSIQEFEKFKQDFRNTAFTCRYWACPHASVGFEDESQRHQHEQHHAPRFVCDADACQYPPFATVQALNSHKAKLHKDSIPNIKIKAPRILQKQKASAVPPIQRDREIEPASSRQPRPTQPNIQQLPESNSDDPASSPHQQSTTTRISPQRSVGGEVDRLFNDGASPAGQVSELFSPTQSPRIPPVRRPLGPQPGFGRIYHSSLHSMKPSRHVSVHSFLQPLADLVLRRIAWSNMGTIASISPDGLSVQARFLRANPENGVWGLSEPTTFYRINAAQSNPIVHLAWSETDKPHLAVIDYHGRVDIFSVGPALNSHALRRARESDNVCDYGGVVACHWLQPASRQKLFHTAAVKVDDQYRFEKSHFIFSGPFHPHPRKSALICITEAGVLKMFWMRNDHSFGLVTHQPAGIEKLSSVERASFCRHNGRFILPIRAKFNSLKSRRHHMGRYFLIRFRLHPEGRDFMGPIFSRLQS